METNVHAARQTGIKIMVNKNSLITYGGLGLFGIFGPILFPEYTLSIAYLDDGIDGLNLDTLGGQMAIIH